MADARMLREITDALRILTEKADAAGSPTARSLLIMTAEAIRREADKAEQAAGDVSPRPPGRT